jgi:isochorismate pyruvate lyase
MYKIPFQWIAAAAFIVACAPAFADPGVAMTKSNTPSPEETKTLMAPYRERIDALDAQIVALLGKRFDVIHEVAVFKAQHGIHPIQPARIEEVVQHARAQAEKSGVNPDLIEKLYRVIIQTACDEEEHYARAQEAKAK